MPSAVKVISRLQDLSDVPTPLIDGDIPVWQAAGSTFTKVNLGSLATTAAVATLAASIAATYAPLISPTFSGTVTFPAQAANLIFAGPATGANAVPTWRSLVAADIPTLTLAKISDAGGAASRQVGTASGNVPILDSNGKLATAVIPSLAISEFLGVVASQAAMLALTGQRGDWANRSDLNATFILNSDDPTQVGNWTELLYPAAPVSSVNGQIGTVVLTTGNIAEGSNLYYTDGRAAAASPVQSVAGRTGAIVLAAADIPSLDAAKITTGTFAAGRIPSLAGSIITSGTIGVSQLARQLENMLVSVTGTTDFNGSTLTTNNGAGSWSASAATIQAANPWASPWWTLVVNNVGTGTAATYTSTTASIDPAGATFVFSSGNDSGGLTGSATVSRVPTFGSFNYMTGGDGNDTILYTANAAGNAALERYRVTGKATLATHKISGNVSATVGTITTNTPILDLNATWNGSSVAFTGFKINVVNTASSAASKVVDIQVGGATKISADVSGNGTWAGGLTVAAACTWNGRMNLNDQLVLSGGIFYTGSQNNLMALNENGYSSSNSQQTVVRIAPSISQTGTAGYNCLLVNPSDATTGSGLCLPIRLQSGSVDRFWVDNKSTVFIANSGSVPESNPTGGGYLYVDAGALKYHGSGGTVTTVAAA